MARLKSEAGFTLTELLIVAAILGFTMAAVLGIYQVTQRVTFFATAGEDAQLQGRAVLDRLVADFQLLNSGRTTTTGAISTATTSSITFLADYDNTLDSFGNFITVTDDPAPTGATSVTVNNASSISCGGTMTLTDGPIMESRTLAPGGASGTACKTASGANTQLGFAAGESLLTYYPRGSFVRSVETIYYLWDGDPDVTPGAGNLCRSVGTPCAAPFADPIASGVKAFQLTYLDSAGATIPVANLATQGGRDTIRAIRISISIRSQSGDQTVTRTMQVTVRPRNFF